MISTLSVIREKKPLVHAITNFVTANFCADVLLAVGASPMMTDDPREAADATMLADALYLNIGTLNQMSMEAAFLAGNAAKKKEIPIVFDPVGAGATQLRNNGAKEILSQLAPDVVKGNLAEILFLAGESGIASRGVDAGNISLEQTAISCVLRKFALDHHCIVIATGKDDFVTDGRQIAVVRNGTPMLEKVTGTGCALGALCAAAAIEKTFSAQLAAVLAMSIAGEMAKAKTCGNACGTFKMNLLDALGDLSDEDVRQRGQYEFLA